MGLREKVALALITVVITQITTLQCGPSASRLEKLQRYLDARGVKNMKSIFDNSSRIAKKTPPRTSMYKAYNFPEIEYPLNTSPTEPFTLETYYTSNPSRLEEKEDTNPKIKQFNDLKKDLRMKRKLDRIHENYQATIDNPSSNLSPNPDPVWSKGKETFPEVQYPLNAMEIWMPYYWNPSMLTPNEQRHEHVDLTIFDTKMPEQSKGISTPFKKQLKSKSKQFIEEIGKIIEKMSKTALQSKPGNDTVNLDTAKVSTNGRNSGYLTKPDSNNSTAAMEEVTNKTTQVFDCQDLSNMSKPKNSNSKDLLNQFNSTNITSTCREEVEIPPQVLSDIHLVTPIPIPYQVIERKTRINPSNEKHKHINGFKESDIPIILENKENCDEAQLLRVKKLDEVHLNSMVNTTDNFEQQPIETMINHTLTQVLPEQNMSSPVSDVTQTDIDANITSHFLTDDAETSIHSEIAALPQQKCQETISVTNDEPLNVKIPLPVVKEDKSIPTYECNNNKVTQRSNINKTPYTSIIVVPVSNSVNEFQLPIVETGTGAPIIVFLPASHQSGITIRPSTITPHALPLTYDTVPNVSVCNTPLQTDVISSNITNVPLSSFDNVVKIPCKTILGLESLSPDFEMLPNNSMCHVSLDKFTLNKIMENNLLRDIPFMEKINPIFPLRNILPSQAFVNYSPDNVSLGRQSLTMDEKSPDICVEELPSVADMITMNEALTKHSLCINKTDISTNNVNSSEETLMPTLNILANNISLDLVEDSVLPGSNIDTRAISGMIHTNALQEKTMAIVNKVDAPTKEFLNISAVDVNNNVDSRKGIFPEKLRTDLVKNEVLAHNHHLESPSDFKWKDPSLTAAELFVNVPNDNQRMFNDMTQNDQHLVLNTSLTDICPSENAANNDSKNSLTSLVDISLKPNRYTNFDKNPLMHKDLKDSYFQDTFIPCNESDLLNPDELSPNNTEDDVSFTEDQQLLSVPVTDITEVKQSLADDEALLTNIISKVVREVLKNMPTSEPLLSKGFADLQAVQEDDTSLVNIRSMDEVLPDTPMASIRENIIPATMTKELTDYSDGGLNLPQDKVKDIPQPPDKFKSDGTLQLEHRTGDLLTTKDDKSTEYIPVTELLEADTLLPLAIAKTQQELDDDDMLLESSKKLTNTHHTITKTVQHPSTLDKIQEDIIKDVKRSSSTNELIDTKLIDDKIFLNSTSNEIINKDPLGPVIQIDITGADMLSSSSKKVIGPYHADITKDDNFLQDTFTTDTSQEDSHVPLTVHKTQQIIIEDDMLSSLPLTDTNTNNDKKSIQDTALTETVKESTQICDVQRDESCCINLKEDSCMLSTKNEIQQDIMKDDMISPSPKKSRDTPNANKDDKLTQDSSLTKVLNKDSPTVDKIQQHNIDDDKLSPSSKKTTDTTLNDFTTDDESNQDILPPILKEDTPAPLTVEETQEDIIEDDMPLAKKLTDGNYTDTAKDIKSVPETSLIVETIKEDLPITLAIDEIQQDRTKNEPSSETSTDPHVINVTKDDELIKDSSKIVLKQDQLEEISQTIDKIIHDTSSNETTENVTQSSTTIKHIDQLNNKITPDLSEADDTHNVTRPSDKELLNESVNDKNKELKSKKGSTDTKHSKTSKKRKSISVGKTRTRAHVTNKRPNDKGSMETPSSDSKLIHSAVTLEIKKKPPPSTDKNLSNSELSNLVKYLYTAV